MKSTRYLFEFLALRILLVIFALLPRRTASNIGGFIGRTVGVRMGASRKAMRNFGRAMPGVPAPHKNESIKNMWDNLGRVFAEYAHLQDIAAYDTDIIDKAGAIALIKNGQPVLFFGAHLANWEVASMALYKQHNIPVHITYRAPNNPHVDKLLHRIRTAGGKLKAHSKSRQGGRDLIKALKENQSAAIMIDQKYNEGVEMDFFAYPALTNPAFVQLAQKYNMPLVPAHTQRMANGRFRLVFDAPVKIYIADGKTPRPVVDVIEDAHIILENYITELPGQWLWLHRRWPDE